MSEVGGEWRDGVKDCLWSGEGEVGGGGVTKTVSWFATEGFGVRVKNLTLLKADRSE
jgi:hypothetical protein